MDVSRYVEIKNTYQIHAVNVPADKKMLLYPSYVEVSFKCKYPLIDDKLDNVSVVVDYEEFITSLSGKCQVRLMNLSDNVLSYQIDPVAVDCVLEDR